MQQSRKPSQYFEVNHPIWKCFLRACVVHTWYNKGYVVVDDDDDDDDDDVYTSRFQNKKKSQVAYNLHNIYLIC